MALSILIPVYNFDVTGLVRALARQLSNTGKEGEIILLDDGSDPAIIALNKTLETIAAVSFHYNEKNEGRMAVRHRLSRLASYSHLLYLDCDSGIIKDDFLAVYFELTAKNISLASGGRVYSADPPGDCSLMLHWKYGSERESADRRTGFMTNNFLVKKELLDQLEEPVQMRGYGHEDSWWGIHFERSGIHCLHINNPVLHLAIEKAGDFLVKAENALGNLLLLERSTDKKLLSRHVKIFRWYNRLKRTGLAGIYLFFEKPFHQYFRKNLLSCKPSLFFFDCYRLAALVRMGKKGSGV